VCSRPLVFPQWINDEKFQNNFANGLCKILEESGLTTRWNSDSRNIIVIHIYWRKLSEKENLDDV